MDTLLKKLSSKPPVWFATLSLVVLMHAAGGGDGRTQRRQNGHDNVNDGLPSLFLHKLLIVYCHTEITEITEIFFSRG